MELLIKRLTNLLTVKSLITMVLLGVFAYLTLTGDSVSPEFSKLFEMVVIFYFGTQAGKAESK